MSELIHLRQCQRPRVFHAYFFTSSLDLHRNNNDFIIYIFAFGSIFMVSFFDCCIWELNINTADPAADYRSANLCDASSDATTNCTSCPIVKPITDLNLATFDLDFFLFIFISPEWIYPVAKETKNNKLNNLTINMNSQHVHLPWELICTL